MKEYENLFWELFKANGEQEIKVIEQNNSLLQNPDNWSPYGGDDTNFSVFDNQQPNPVSALIEKITNSIDSILLKKCKLKDIDPTTINAPQSMNKALEQFFDIKNGELGEITSKERTELSKSIQLIATGEEKKPDLLIFDNGEGQHPENFPNTFLSIKRGNKNRIYFVQGQFNMGSTGAVVFCGDYKYQLIASKQNQTIFQKENKYNKNSTGFTLVRRHKLTEIEEREKRYKYSWYEYFSIKGKIPSFDTNDLDIGLCDNIKFKTGAIVKLFSYKLPRGCMGTIHDGLYHELNQSLYKPALPFLLSDKREKYIYKKGIDKLTVAGNDIRLRDKKNILEEDSFYANFKHQDIGSVKIKAILLKKGSDKKQQDNRKRRFIGKKSIVFTINGQVHAFYGSTEIKNWGFNYLKDSLLIHVDCTNIRVNFRQDLFKADRYSFKETQKLDKLIGKIKDALKSNSGLREANENRKNQLLKGADDTNSNNIIKNMLSKNPAKKELINLLKNYGNLLGGKNNNSKAQSKRKKEKKPISSKRFPSIFKINLKEKNGERVKGIPLGGKGIIEFETDVQNDYFQRPNEQGELILEILGYNSNSSEHPNPQPSPNKVEELFNTTIVGPDDHSIKITLEPTQKLNVGDKIQLNAKLSSPEGDMEAIFYVKIKKKGETKTKKAKESQKFNPPPLIKISKKDDKWVKNKDEDWNVDDWDDSSIIHIITAENKIDAIAINMSANILKKYISSKKVKDEKTLEAFKSKYISQIYLHGLFLFHSIEKNKKDNDEDSESHVSKIFKSYGEALLYLDLNEELLKFIE